MSIGRDFKKVLTGLTACFLLLNVGCGWRPYQPVKLETILPNEEAFLIPFTDAVDKQQSSHTEEFLTKNLVYSQQVRIPQQWIQTGYQLNWGDWKDAALLIRVDKSPVTREWTADPNSGTSNKNEAVWVMTSDQVEFSTGWTCTARIASREDSVKFLANYPNGTLSSVMDKEIRGKLQSEFGLEVTDLPMEKLRSAATPHIQKVVKNVTEYFKVRGISIVNLGITGGFIYKDTKISDTMVELFNSEQKKIIAQATAAAILTEKKGRADGILAEKKAEADGIRAVADAKLYEIQKAKENLEVYMSLKRLEIERAKLEKWDGRFPSYFMGGANTPEMLLQIPTPDLSK